LVFHGVPARHIGVSASLGKAGTALYDLDSLIIDKEKRSVADIFAAKGEEYFRYTD